MNSTELLSKLIATPFAEIILELVHGYTRNQVILGLKYISLLIDCVGRETPKLFQKFVFYGLCGIKHDKIFPLLSKLSPATIRFNFV